MLNSTSKFKVLEIIYDNGNFAIAKGHWNDDSEPKKIHLACRWYEEDGIGYPQTFGKPQWMLLPSESIELDFINALSKDKKVVLSFS